MLQDGALNSRGGPTAERMPEELSEKAPSKPPNKCLYYCRMVIALVSCILLFVGVAMQACFFNLARYFFEKSHATAACLRTLPGRSAGR